MCRPATLAQLCARSSDGAPLPAAHAEALASYLQSRCEADLELLA